MEQKFTTMAQEAISDAVQNASAAGNAQVETLHLLDALLRQENGVIRGLIEAAGGNAQNISAAVHQAQDALPSASGSTTAQPQVYILNAQNSGVFCVLCYTEIAE